MTVISRDETYAKLVEVHLSNNTTVFKIRFINGFAIYISLFLVTV